VIRALGAVVFLLRWTLILAILVIAGVVALVATEPGTRWLFVQAERHAPVDLTLDTVDGTLFRGLKVSGLRLRAQDNEFAVDHVRIRVHAASLLRSTVRVSELHLDGGHVDLATPPAGTREPSSRSGLPEQVPLPVRVLIERFNLSSLEVRRAGQEFITIDALSFRLDASADRIHVTGLELGLAELEVRLDARIRPSGLYPLEAETHWRLVLPDDVAAALDVAAAEGTIRLTGNLAEQLTLQHRLRAGLELNTALSVTDPLGSPRFEANNRWNAFGYRMGPERVLDLTPGELDLQGSPDDWLARVTGGVSVDEWPPLQLSGTALGSLNHIEIPELALHSEAGILTVQGRIDRADGVTWNLALLARDFDPGAIFPEWAGQLTAAISSTGNLPVDGEHSAQLELTELRGQLRGQAIDGTARLRALGNRIDIDQLDLGMDANRIRIQGRVDETLQLELALRAPELNRIHPDLEGAIRLDGHVSGTRGSPHISMHGTGTALRIQATSLEAFSVSVDAGLGVDTPVDVTLRISGLGIGGIAITDAALLVTGQATSHRIRASVDSPELGPVAISATGRYDMDARSWTGVLQDLDLDHPLAGPWTLRAPAAVTASATEAGLETLCLGRESARLCLSGDWSRNLGTQVQGSLDDLDLAWLAPFLPEETAIDGTLDLRAEGSLDPSGVLRGTLSVPPAEGVLRNVLDEEAERAFPYRDLRLDVRVEEHSIQADMGLSFLEAGSAQASLQLRPEAESYRVDGRIQAALDDLEWAGAFTPKVHDVRGRLKMDVALGGWLSDPAIEGLIQLDDGHVIIPEAGLELEIPRLVAEVGSIEEARLSGELRSGGESLFLEGDLGFSQEQGPRAEIWIRGDNFLALNRPDIRARLSPDLTVEIDAERLSVRGEIIVPWARILPPDLPPGAVTVSRDVIVVGEEKEPGTGLPLDIRVRVLLGEDVRLEAYGLNAHLTGDVDVIDIQGRPSQIFGEVSVLEGNYRAWGQNLTVEEGLILFQGPPDTPTLDIRAVRNIPEHNVVAGLEITGTPQQLQSRIFSEPPMDDTEALALLVTGRPLAGASGSDGNLLAGAAAAWGLERGNLITQRLGSELGLDSVEIDTSGGIGQSALTLGTYLSPRLLLRYSMNLFDNSSRVMLRLDLTPALSVETTSSALSQAIDLIYRIER
jgi:translocation and assembly module TamB